jgi:hypothetical protein
MKVLGGFHAVRNILLLLLVYNLVCIFSFAGIYMGIGFDKHFQLPPDIKPTYANALYYSFATQATVMAGEIVPKTALGRGVLSVQITSAFLSTMVLLVPWVNTLTRGTTSQL